MGKVCICALTAIALFAACKKDNNVSNGKAKVMLINASPDSASSYDYYFNDVKLNTQSAAYPSHSSYINIDAKNYSVKIAAANTINPVAELGANFGSGKNFSVFAYDTLNAGKIKAFAVEDNLTAPPAGKVKVRFFYLAPVAIAVDILANDAVIFNNRTYADNVSEGGKGAFTTIDAGTYTIKVRLAGSAEPIPALINFPDVKLEDGKIYTIFSKGKVTGTGNNALGAEIIVNN